jgi:SAM-dependent methyltransferase
MQCFLNEYVYACAADEADQVDRLATRLSDAIKHEVSIPNSLIAAVACYRPLHAIPGHEQLLARQIPDALSDLVRQQVAEPLRERQIAAGIHRLTGIRDSVSTLVRDQYEQNPYPRWSKLPAHIPKVSFPDFLKQRLPHIDSSTLPGQAGARIDALNAGCGTGQHPINMTLRIDAMRLLAIDLSLNSLAHAARKSQEIGLSNISFAQADILELRRITARFDLIESMGVLHHLADPSDGLAILCELLKDNGVIRLGLYSELGRRSIVACRQDIARRGIECTAASIRAYRQELKTASMGDPRKGATRFTDFYSLSECRDLLFHVQEHHFTIPGLRKLLDEHRLEFLGFDLEPDQWRPFVRVHPELGMLTDLGTWNAHEQQHPDTFSRMYILWARKKPAALL